MKRMLAIIRNAGILLLLGLPYAHAQKAPVSDWHYRPQGSDFVKVNGKQRFNRALYGSNTAFRVEAGDLPEFALYLPGVGGCLRLGLIQGNQSKWLIEAQQIKTIYRPGSMLYEISDNLLGKGLLRMAVIPVADKEGMLLQIKAEQVPAGVTLCWAWGGATGKKLSRDGDIGADPESSFYLQPDYCKGNQVKIAGNKGIIRFGKEQTLEALFPQRSVLSVADATQQHTPAAFIQSEGAATPALAGKIPLTNTTDYFLIGKPEAAVNDDAALPAAFTRAEAARKLLADRIQVSTPDKYINTLGGALGMAADGIWDSPTYMHGAVAWRMRLNAWRGPYVADPLGWHDRARTHFSSYALSQLTEPQAGPVVADTALHLARQLERLGTSMFSSGYICRNPNGDFRPHHYDMNLVYIDQLLRHFSWTGDTAYVRQMWPTLQRHLAWEKRNYDRDNDGLYDAYCCIWASDALQYSGGAVTHSTAYNYFANRQAAFLAALIGKDAAPYQQEADKIYQAIQSKLWMRDKGSYAEYRDALGNQLLHPAAGLWTIYHAIDSRVPDAFQAYQSLRYIDTQIPHIPVNVQGKTSPDFYLLSTTNWQPYSWSLNNVALAENLHTALAYWQGNRPQAAFELWKSALIESMYMSASPGGFSQLSRYDAARGELYRDFADPIGMAARSLVEGLFGIVPDALRDTLTIHPGLPAEWKQAALTVPDIKFSFKRTGAVDDYIISSFFRKALHLKMAVNAPATQIAAITVNGKPIQWKQITRVGKPAIELAAPAARNWHVIIRWKGAAPENPQYDTIAVPGQTWACNTRNARILQVFDPQQVLGTQQLQPHRLTAPLNAAQGARTFFMLLQQGGVQWWQPVNIRLQNAVNMIAAKAQPENALSFSLNHVAAAPLQGTLEVNTGGTAYSRQLTIPAGKNGITVDVSAAYVVTGTNRIQWKGSDGSVLDTTLINWNVKAGKQSNAVKLEHLFNDKLTHIFTNSYLSPRPQSPTLQLPIQGIGDWCYPLTQADIDDSGLRKAAAGSNTFTLPQGIVFATPADSTLPNILYTSRWDNYPHSATVPLTGKAAHAYLLMAGSTNAMQSQLVNGVVTVFYKDGTHEVLPLKNPDTWCPIEQDYQDDEAAFNLSLPRPPRVYLKTGTVGTTLPKYAGIKGYSNRAIEGGAATVLDMPLDNRKELDHLQLETIANDVVIGLMAVSLMP